MQPRLDAMKISPGAYKAMAGLQAYVDQSGLERSLIELVKIRASQINGCAFCITMHTTDARKLGETDERMHLLNAWREAPVFSERERAAQVRIDQAHASRREAGCQRPDATGMTATPIAMSCSNVTVRRNSKVRASYTSIVGPAT